MSLGQQNKACVHNLTLNLILQGSTPICQCACCLTTTNQQCAAFYKHSTSFGTSKQGHIQHLLPIHIILHFSVHELTYYKNNINTNILINFVRISYNKTYYYQISKTVLPSRHCERMVLEVLYQPRTVEYYRFTGI